MSLPDFNEHGWLPQGHFLTEWEEIEARFAGLPGSRRNFLYNLLRQWEQEVRERQLAGILILDGSFVSARSEPGDIDYLFVFDEASESILKIDPEARRLMDHSECKKRGIGDVFVFAAATVRAYPQFCRMDLFDFDKTGRPKGVVEVII